MKKMLFMLISLTVIITTSCSDRGNNSQEASQLTVTQEEAIPVKVKNVKDETFTQFQNYTAVLHGANEATKTSSLSGMIEDIYFNVGDYVEKDDVILSFPKDTSSAQYYQSLAGYEAAEKTYNRMKNLFASNGISRQDFDQAKTQYEVQLANWNAVSDMIEVKAPVSGYITQLSVDRQDSVSPGDTLFTVSDYQTMTASISIPDSSIAALKDGQTAEAHWEGYSITGEVTRVNLSKDAKSKAFTAQLVFDNSQFIIPSGITASIRIRTLEHDNAIVLHKDEFITDTSGSYTYVVRQDYAEKRDITLGLHQGFYYEVESGLSEEDTLVTEGLMLLDDHAKVVVING